MLSGGQLDGWIKVTCKTDGQKAELLFDDEKLLLKISLIMFINQLHIEFKKTKEVE